MRIKSNRYHSAMGAMVALEPQTPEQQELDHLLKAVSVVRALNDLKPANDFSVIRDPRTCAVVIAIRERDTGELVDLCSPDALLETLEYLPGQWQGRE